MHYQVTINNRVVTVSKNLSILEACVYAGVSIPRFCYHEELSVSGNCRMCLVETDKAPKPIASCATPLVTNMSIFTESPFILKARESVLESLLLNHPLDCPVCDQGGECDLQNQSKFYGGVKSRFFFTKRAVEDKRASILIKMVMTRCIHCTRCVRFGFELAGGGVPFGTLGRGGSTEIGTYVDTFLSSEISGNIIDLCPVGALTAKSYAFKIRPWELSSRDSIDLSDSSGSDLYVQYKNGIVNRIVPKKNKDLNGSWISDKARFSFDALLYNRSYTIMQCSRINTFELLTLISRNNLIVLLAGLSRQMTRSILFSCLYTTRLSSRPQWAEGIEDIGLTLNAEMADQLESLNFTHSRGVRRGLSLVKPRFQFTFINNFSQLIQKLFGHSFYSKTKLLLINRNISLNSLFLLNALDSTSKGLLKVRMLPDFATNQNLHVWGVRDKISSLNYFPRFQLCLICSSLLKIENTLLNLKLRLKHNKSTIEIYNLGRFATSNYKIRYLSLKLELLPSILSSKVPTISKKLHTFSTSMIILGESLTTRISSNFLLSTTLKKRLPGLLVYFITKYNNFEGSRICFIKPLSRRLLLRSNNIFSFNLEDTCSTRKFLCLTKNPVQNLFWFSSHQPRVTSGGIKQVLPVSSDLEEGGLYFNFEQKLKLAEGSVSFKEVKGLQFSLHSLLFSFLLYSSGQKAYSTLNTYSLKNYLRFCFLRETLLRPSLAGSSHKRCWGADRFSTISFIKNSLYVSTYPDKSSFEDFYRTTLRLKNSLLMLECSRELRKKTTLSFDATGFNI